MSIELKVRTHFQADARRFDAIYEDAKGPVRRWVDGVWRGVVRRRFELALQVLGPLTGKTVLDVGCGSGRYCLAYARRGAARVVGVDFAPRMIELARTHAGAAGLRDVCEFRTGAFPEVCPEEQFDVSTGMGLFDYVADPVTLLTAMRERTRQTMVLSFPRSREWRAPLRRLRFWLSGCPLFLYTEAEARRALAWAGLNDYEWIPLDRDYVVVVRLAA